MDPLIPFVSALLGLILGVWLGRKTFHRSQRKVPGTASYMQGLNFLLDDQPDKAVEEFVRALEVTPDTLETHLALGKLMRRQGHVNRAIRIHQNVLARPSLASVHQHQVHLELARDFMAAGLLDRAELLLQEVISESAELRSRAQRHLIEIYQDESEWAQAIEVASALLQSKYVKSQPDEKKYVLRMISHFHCELAEQSARENNLDSARKHLANAASADKSGIRVAVLSATKLNVEGSFRQAIKLLGKLNADNPAWFSACLPTLLESFEGLHPGLGPEKLWSHLQATSVPEPSSAEVLFIVERLVGGSDASDTRLALARDILQGAIHQHRGDEMHSDSSGGRSELALLNELLGLDLSVSDNVFKEVTSKGIAAGIHTELEHHFKSMKMYRCNNCGFSGRQLHWRCPSCKRWDSCQRIEQGGY